MALLEFPNTPIPGIEATPVQLLMNRRLRSSLPMTGTMLIMDVPKVIRQSFTVDNKNGRKSMIKEQDNCLI